MHSLLVYIFCYCQVCLGSHLSLLHKWASIQCWIPPPKKQLKEPFHWCVVLPNTYQWIPLVEGFTWNCSCTRKPSVMNKELILCVQWLLFPLHLIGDTHQMFHQTFLEELHVLATSLYISGKWVWWSNSMQILLLRENVPKNCVYNIVQLQLGIQR